MNPCVYTGARVYFEDWGYTLCGTDLFEIGGAMMIRSNLPKGKAHLTCVEEMPGAYPGKLASVTHVAKAGALSSSCYPDCTRGIILLRADMVEGERR